MAHISVRQISKDFVDAAGRTTRVLRGLSLDVLDGEFLTLLGPSGCGKSTLIRIVAGLEPQTAGSIAIDGAAVDRLLPKQRNVAMVFQSYALYPHMTVAENLALPLRMRRMSAWHRLPWVGQLFPRHRGISESIVRDVAEVAKSLELAHLLERKPGQLSGGQRQRVALARAMVRHPAVFLMDEPLSNLDAKLRVQMRAEITELHRKLGATFVYVTHDQTEAMTMSDRVAVMFDGEIVQVGPPQTLYAEPANRHVAEFIGSPRINMIEGVVRSGDVIEAGGAALPISCELTPGSAVTLGFRPEAFHLVERSGPGTMVGRLQRIEHTGSDLFIYFQVLGQQEPLVLRAAPQQGTHLAPDAVVHVAPAFESALLFDRAGAAVRRTASKVATFRSRR
jgi:multiple sugar transport system ATP-binding protein